MKQVVLKLALALITVSTFISKAQNSNSGIADTSNDTSGSFAAAENDTHGATIQSNGLRPTIIFNDEPLNHNMHITSDGKYYYTINGGKAANGRINKYDLSGTFIKSYPIEIDGRGLSYNKADGYFYASTYLGDIVQITDLDQGFYNVAFPGIMLSSQATFAISPDGKKFYDFYRGTLVVRDFNNGALLETITGLSYGFISNGNETTVAVDSGNVYTWDALSQVVYAYDLSGKLKKKFALDSGSYGRSLSIANGHLFVAKDGNYQVGTWYGYNISGLTSISDQAAKQEFSIYPNPSSGKFIINGNANAIEVYSLSGDQIISETNLPQQASNEIDLSKYAKGTYLLRVYTGGTIHTEKIEVQ